MPKVLYIAGYGRSGSTVLGTILGSHPDLVHVGEVGSLLEDWSDGRQACSCGFPYGKCEFWRDFCPDKVLNPQLIESVRKIERIWSLPRLLLGLFSAGDRLVYQTCEDNLFEYITNRSGKASVVDSSKSVWLRIGRFLALHQIATQDLFVLHLVRNGLAVMESQVLTGDNRALEGLTPPPRWLSLRTALGWTITNSLVPLLARALGADRYLLIRYEDMVKEPTQVLQRIGEFAGFDAEILCEQISRKSAFVVGHTVGGNRLRQKGQVKLRREVKENPGNHLKIHQLLLFKVVGGWLQRRHGYS